MAGEIQIGGTTFATESGGTVTVANVDSATNRQNLGLEIGVDVQAFDTDTTKNDVANTFTANQTISVTDNTNAALSVTQLGTGNALVVEDDGSNPDSTPFVVDNAGHVGVSFSSTQTTPDAFLQVGVGNRTANSYTFRPTVLIGDRPYGDGNSILEFSPNLAVGNGVIISVDSSKNLKFANSTSGVSSERMRIDSSGNVLVGTEDTTLWDNSAGTTADNGVHISATGTEGFVSVARYNGVCVYLNRTGTDGTIIQFRKDGSIVGSISTNANSLPSDRNFKKDINDLEIGLDLVKKLKPKTYRYAFDDDNSPFMTGLIAQDLEESLVEVGVSQNDSWILQYNADEEENQPKYNLDYSKLIPILTKAIQEQQALIESQQSQIDGLTVRIEALETA